jgi:sec-independent protein translocase protein TatB
MVFVALLALLLIGPKQLPEVAKTLGKFMNDLKRTTNGLKDEFQSQIKFDQEELRKKIMETPARTKNANYPPPQENSFSGDPNLHPPTSTDHAQQSHSTPIESDDKNKKT